MTKRHIIVQLLLLVSVILMAHAGLPSRIQFSDGSQISYVYDMTGAKKQVTYSTVSGGSTVTTRLDYYDRFVLSNYSLSHMPLEDDGIYTVPDGYCFYIRDYLGSVRALTKQSGQCVQRNLYYPFGGLYEWMIYENPQPPRNSENNLKKWESILMSQEMLYGVKQKVIVKTVKS